MNRLDWLQSWKMIFVTAIFVTLGFHAVIGDEALVVDTTPPSVRVLTPGDGDSVSDEISLTAESSDDIGVSGVAWQIDGTDVDSEVLEAPYLFDWNTRNESNGEHLITAIASDAAENTARASVTVNVNNDITPEDFWIYQDSLLVPWIDASWDTELTLMYRKKVYDGKCAIKATQQRWGALSFHFGGWRTSELPNISDYQNLKFSVYGESRGVDLVVSFENDQDDEFPQVHYEFIPPYTWINVSIPVSQLNPKDQSVSRLIIQDMSGSRRTYLVDKIRFSAQ